MILPAESILLRLGNPQHKKRSRHKINTRSTSLWIVQRLLKCCGRRERAPGQLPKSTGERQPLLFVFVRPRREKSRKLSDSSKKKKSNGVFVTKLVCLSWSIFYTFLWCCGLIFDALSGFLDSWFLHDDAIAHWWLKFFQVAQECKILNADSQLHLWYSLISASQAARGPSKTFYFVLFHIITFALSLLLPHALF